MNSRKKECMIEMKEAMLKRMNEQKLLRKTCREKISILEDQHIKWYGYYVVIAFALLSAVGAMSFITYGYDENGMNIVRNLFWIAGAGVLSYCVIIVSQKNSQKSLIAHWRDIEVATCSELEKGREAIKVFNNFIYLEE